LLAGGIAHDFNNLLVGVLGNAELALMEPDLPPTIGTAVERIRGAARRASELTNQMLAYSGKGRFEIRAVDVNVRIEPRQKVAVVGETGSGKTTFAKLLTRLMDPTDGVVRVGDVDVSTVRFESLRDRVVMVPQEGMLFSGTVGDNVRMGRPDATDAEIEAAFEALGLESWLSELVAGLDTPVGERGGALSVGERQLVTLVRAAIADPDLLVLDEATSAVDPATELRINRAMDQLASGRTVVTIAHRLSTAEKADRVLVFDEGRLVQDGPHDRLVREPGVYRDLYAAWRRGTAAV